MGGSICVLISVASNPSKLFFLKDKLWFVVSLNLQLTSSAHWQHATNKTNREEEDSFVINMYMHINTNAMYVLFMRSKLIPTTKVEHFCGNRTKGSLFNRGRGSATLTLHNFIATTPFTLLEEKPEHRNWSMYWLDEHMPASSSWRWTRRLRSDRNRGNSSLCCASSIFPCQTHNSCTHDNSEKVSQAKNWNKTSTKRRPFFKKQKGSWPLLQRVSCLILFQNAIPRISQLKLLESMHLFWHAMLLKLAGSKCLVN